jgi:hypothetical protein
MRANAIVQKVIRLAMSAPVPYARPSSVENERKKMVVGWWRNKVLSGVLALVVGYYVVKHTGWEFTRY